MKAARELGLASLFPKLYLLAADPDHELFLALSGGGVVMQTAGYFAVSARYHTVEVEIDRVVDFRQAATRILFEREMGAKSWGSLLRDVYHRELGGDEFTDVFGAFLRQSGAQGLVYPSARCNAGVKFANGELVDWYGFNFLDYRNCVQPSSVHLSQPDGSGALPWPDFHIVVPDPSDTAAAGSWQVNGVEQAHHAFWNSGQHLSRDPGVIGSKTYAQGEGAIKNRDTLMKTIYETYIAPREEAARRNAAYDSLPPVHASVPPPPKGQGTFVRLLALVAVGGAVAVSFIIFAPH